MCVSLLERVKQGKSNIILILILSARSQDRDQQGSAKRLLLNYFNPLGRKTETDSKVENAQKIAFQSTRSQDRDKVVICVHLCDVDISIHSVARPRPEFVREHSDIINISIHSVARPRHTLSVADVWTREISIHSVARPRHPSGTGHLSQRIFQSTRSQDRDFSDSS